MVGAEHLARFPGQSREQLADGANEVEDEFRIWREILTLAKSDEVCVGDKRECFAGIVVVLCHLRTILFNYRDIGRCKYLRIPTRLDSQVMMDFVFLTSNN